MSEADRVLSCPKCGGAMELIATDHVTVDRCQSCSGLWFDRDEYQSIAVHGQRLIDQGERDEGGLMERRTGVTCPVCLVPMDRRAISVDPDIWVESCPECQGHFFDAGEFRAYRTILALDFLSPLETPRA